VGGGGGKMDLWGGGGGGVCIDSLSQNSKTVGTFYKD